MPNSAIFGIYGKILYFQLFSGYRYFRLFWLISQYWLFCTCFPPPHFQHVTSLISTFIPNPHFHRYFQISQYWLFLISLNSQISPIFYEIRKYIKTNIHTSENFPNIFIPFIISKLVKKEHVSKPYLKNIAIF